MSEVTHSIFYAPVYLAINNGYFDEAGIKIELTNAGGADKVMTSIASKSADVGLMGPEATIYCHVEGQRNYPVIFGQLTKRDGSFLVGRTAEPDFKWSDTAGKRVLAGRKGGVPAMTLQYVMNQAGVDTNNANFDTSVAFNMMVGAFESDKTISYCTMFEPTASEFVAAGKGAIVASVGKDSGEVPYTAFSASKSYLNKNPDLLKKFLQAVDKGYKFMLNNSSEIVAEKLMPSFVGTSKESIAASIKSYIDIDAWSSSPVMTEESFNRLMTIMENAGELKEKADYNLAVDNSIAKLIVT